MRSSHATAQAATAAVENPANIPDEDRQLELRLFAVIGRYRTAPPERALWRELLNLAIGDGLTVKAPGKVGRTLAAATVWAVGITVYMRANAAGIVEGFSIKTLAADCRLDPRTVKAALATLRSWHVVKQERPKRRRPSVWRMNLGGLDWPAVRARAAASGGTTPPLSGGTTPPLKSYPEGHDLSTRHRAADVVVPDAAETQQQRDGRRFNGIIAVISMRARDLQECGWIIDHDEDRLRAEVAAGNWTVDELQRVADDFTRDLAEVTRKRRLGPWS